MNEAQNDCIFKILGLLSQVLKQVEDLQDLVFENKRAIEILQDIIDKAASKNPAIVPVVFFKKNAVPPTNIKIENPKQKNDIIFWLPRISNCNSIEGKN